MIDFKKSTLAKLKMNNVFISVPKDDKGKQCNQ